MFLTEAPRAQRNSIGNVLGRLDKLSQFVLSEIGKSLGLR